MKICRYLPLLSVYLMITPGIIGAAGQFITENWIQSEIEQLKKDVAAAQIEYNTKEATLQTISPERDLYWHGADVARDRAKERFEKLTKQLNDLTKLYQRKKESN